MNIPVLSSITSIIGGTISDTFKSLFKPTSLAAAGLIVALNLLLIFPPLAEAGLPLVASLESLPIAWQVLLASFFIPLLGYVLNNFGGYFLDLVSGIAVSDFWFARWRVKYWQKEHDKLEKNLDQYFSNPAPTPAQEVEAGRAARRLAAEFPQPENIAPTRLGNVMASATSYPYEQYGAHFGALWPAMSATLQNKNEKLSTRVGDNLDNLTFLATLIVLLGVVAAELVFVGLLFGRATLVVGLLIIIVLVYFIDQAAVQKALDWGRDIRLAFDLYIEDLNATLRLREQKGYGKEKDRKKRWQSISRWLHYGTLKLPTVDRDRVQWPEQDPDWYNQKSYDPLVVVSPPTVVVESRSHQVGSWENEILDDTNRKARLAGRLIEYWFAVTNVDSGEHARPVIGSYLMVSDDRIPAVPERVVDVDRRFEGLRQLAGSDNPEALLWQLGEIPARGSILLRYMLKSEILIDVTSQNAELIDMDTEGKEITLKLRKAQGSRLQPIKIALRAMNADQLPDRASCRVDGVLSKLDLVQGKPEHVRLLEIPNGAESKEIILVFKLNRY